MSFTQTQIDSFFTAVESLYDTAYDISQGALDGAFMALDKGLDFVKEFVDEVKEELNDRAQREAGVEDESPTVSNLYNSHYSRDDKLEVIAKVADKQFGPDNHSWRNFIGTEWGLSNAEVDKWFKQAVETGELTD